MALVLQKRNFNRSKNELLKLEEAIEAVKNDPLGDNNYEAVRYKVRYFVDRLKLYETRRDELKTAVQEDELDILIPKEGEDLHEKLTLWLTHIEDSLLKYQILKGREEEDFEELLLLLDDVVDEYISPLDDPIPDDVIDCDEVTEETCDEEEELMLEGDINPDEISPSGIETGTECAVSMETTADDVVPDERLMNDDLKIFETTTPELESGETPLDLNCDSDSSVSVSVPDALVDKPADNGSLFHATDFFGLHTKFQLSSSYRSRDIMELHRKPPQCGRNAAKRSTDLNHFYWEFRAKS
ncbi:hypothetical protein M8J77_002874 [Diaphorina citri]|nr:hypothetical protein M8J77_002874 [Diaphorina citri]